MKKFVSLLLSAATVTAAFYLSFSAAGATCVRDGNGGYTKAWVTAGPNSSTVEVKNSLEQMRFCSGYLAL